MKKKNKIKWKKWTTLDLVYTLVLLNHELSLIFIYLFIYLVLDQLKKIQDDVM
jgi:hypothetical protein